MPDAVDSLAARVAAEIAEMLDEDDNIVPGTLLHRIAVTEEAGPDELAAFARQVLGPMSDESCAAILDRLAGHMDFLADTIEDIDRL